MADAGIPTSEKPPHLGRENQNTKSLYQLLLREGILNGEKSAYLTSRGKYNGGS